MTRTMIIGNAGGGKSTLCKVISQVHGLPHLAIDQIQWEPDWTPVCSEKVGEIHDEWLKRRCWLIDGLGDWDLLAKRMDAADTIIFVDHPFHVHLWWATKRQVRSILFGRPDAPEGCRMFPVTFRMYAMMWRLHRVTRPQLLKEVRKRACTARVIHIRSPGQLAEFAANPV